MYDLIQDLAMSFMVPITVAGGIKDLEQARKMFHAGADRIGINTGAVKNPKLLSEIARTYGVQAVVLSLEVKKIALGWQIYGDAGRNELGYSLTEWLSMVPMESIGEILVTCVDTDGTLAGFPRDLLKEFDSHNKPIILSGGISSGHEIVSLAKLSPLVRGVAIGLALHDKHIEIPALKSLK
jgi:cyclase